MKLLITGANGQLGRAVTALLNEAGSEVILTEAPAAAGKFSMRALDITDIDEVMGAVRDTGADAIVNCAAYTAVDKQEEDEDLSFKINAIGPRNLAIAAEETGAKLIHISTDYVFDGNGVRPYIETDPTGPVSVYGRTKLAGEQFVESFCRRYFILRTAWLYGDGANFVKTMLRLAESRDSVSVVSDQLGSPTSALELAKACVHLSDTDNYGIFHATCEGSCSWADFAERIFKLSGKNVSVERLTSEQYAAANPSSARRPAYSVLDNRMFRLTDGYTFADWEEAIQVYLCDS